MRIRFWPLVGLVLLASAAMAAADVPSLPKPARYVTDKAGVIPEVRAAALNEKLAAFERQTSDQMLVYVDRRLPEGTTLEELGARSIREWGVGQKGKSNGLVFFVFADDRKMRVEVGYALEGAIPDARAHRITDEIVKPYFQRGDIAGGVEAGMDALLAAARGEPFAGTGRTVAESRRKVTAPAPVFIAVAIAFLGFWGLMAFLIVRGIRRSSGARGAGGSRGGWTTGSGAWSASALSTGADSSWSSSASSSSSSDSSSSSSDFSGGGGDGGGGGSSDSW